MQAVERTRIERDTLEAVLEDKCNELNEYVLNHGRRSIVNHLKGGVQRRMEQLRVAHLEYNKALYANHERLDDPYIYIIGHEIRVRGCLDLVKNYLHSRRDSPASTVSRRSTSESFHTADEYLVRHPSPGHGQPNPVPQTPAGNGQPNPMTQPRPYIPHPTAPPGYGQPNSAAPPMPYTPHLLGRCHHNPVTPRFHFTPHRPPPIGRRRSNDWIHSQLRTPIAGRQEWMNLLQIG